MAKHVILLILLALSGGCGIVPRADPALIEQGRKAQEERLAGQAKYEKERDEFYTKVRLCKENARQLIGLTKNDLLKRCGQWQEVRTTTTVGGQLETLKYGYYQNAVKYYYVSLINGLVTSVQD